MLSNLYFDGETHRKGFGEMHIEEGTEKQAHFLTNHMIRGLRNVHFCNMHIAFVRMDRRTDRGKI